VIAYIFSALAGVALGIVGLRIWQAQSASTAEAPEVHGDKVSEDGTAVGATALKPLPTRLVLFAAAAIAVVAIAVYAFRQDGDMANSPLATTGNGASIGAAQNLDDVDTMIDRLAKRLESEPDDGEGFRMLGWSYVMTDRPEKAIAPFKRALELIPDNPLVHAGYGEALVGIAHNTVTPQSKAFFDKALALDPKEPRSRYFVALWKAQHGQERQALDEWIELANSSPADAQWQDDLRNQIEKTSKKLGVDVPSRLAVPAPAALAPQMPAVDPAAMRAASNLSDGDRQAMISGMVEGLADKLRQNPDDPDGWVRLLRSRMVLGQTDQAAKDLASARKALAGNANGLRTVNMAASALKVPIG